MIFANHAEDAAGEAASHDTGLWARVRDWFAAWAAIFTPDEILRDGLSRRFALRCCNWLWPLEATVRRLIIAAALAFDLARLIPTSSQPARPKQQKSSPPRGAASFRIVSIRGVDSRRVAATAAMAAARTERHLPFPSDDLLRLGASQPRQGRGIVVQRDNPLCRHGRIWSSDPDYIPVSEADYANCSELLFGSPKDRTPPPEHGSDTRRGLHFRIPLQSHDSEWRRIEKEWDRVLPAPGIAARISALAGALNSPEPYIQRLARRLAADPALAALLRGAPPPLLRKPSYDRFPPQVDEDLAMLAYAATQPPDTS